MKHLTAKQARREARRSGYLLVLAFAVIVITVALLVLTERLQ